MRLTPFLSLFALTVLAGMPQGAVAKPPVSFQQGIWFPKALSSIGEWDATEMPLDDTTLDMLGNPPAESYRFINPFSESVETQIIAPISYAAYHEPAICLPGYGFERTATHIIHLFGPDLPVRALVLKNISNNERVLMYEWIQRQDGTISVPDAHTLEQEFIAGDGDKPIRLKSNCIVRAYITVHPADRLGLQARRDLEAVCQGLYAALKKDGGAQAATDNAPTAPLIAEENRAKVRSVLAEFATTKEGGPDTAYLTTPTAMPHLSNHASDNLLPLNVGNFWRMRSQCGSKASQDTLKVVGAVTPPDGVASIEVDINREGKPWRKELYSSEKGTGIFLTGMKDETSPMLVFNKPVPLLRFGFKEGDACSWQGSIRVKGGTYSATAVSRVSGVEPLTTQAGKFTAYRIDTIVTLMNKGKPIDFPSVRWFAPGVGFVRRSFADKGQPATSEITTFHVR